MKTNVEYESRDRLRHKRHQDRAKHLADEMAEALRLRTTLPIDGVEWVVSSSGTLTLLADFAAGTWEGDE